MTFMTGCVVLVMSSCHDKDTDRLQCISLSSCHYQDISNNVIFAFKMS